MKYIDATVRMPDEFLHPMQRFIREEEIIDYEEMMAWDVRPERGVQLSLFYVEADLDPYEDAVAAVETIERCRISRIEEGIAYVWVAERLRPEFRSFAAAFEGRDVLVLPPVEFDEEAAMRMRLAGPGDDLQRTLDELEAVADLTIHHVGPLDAGRVNPTRALTDRQREGVRTALALGYYDVPRSAELADVAAELDCAESTASALLRRAERRVFAVKFGDDAV